MVGLRVLVIGSIVCASLVARADALRLPVVKDSRSIILRATHIVIVEIVSAADDGVDGEKRPMTKLGVRAVEVLKGAIDGDTSAVARVVRYPAGSPATARLYGAWSYSDVPIGARFVVFASAPSGRLANLIVDPNAMYVMPPEAADAVRLANQVHALGFAKALAAARPHAATLDGQFAEYVIARDHRAARDVEALASLMELPALSDEARTGLVMEAQMWTGGDGGARDRLALAMFRIVRLDAAVKLRDNLIGTWIPNLVGADGGEELRTPAQVFRGHARERAPARAAIVGYRGSEPTKPLLDWFARH